METKNEQMWQELIEMKSFEQLTNSEKAFVLGFSSEKNYQFERTILLESKSVYSDLEPRPLILKDEKKGVVIPLYQTILAVAASFIIGFFLFQGNDNGIESDKIMPLAIADTVFVEKRIIDTVIQTKTNYVRIFERNSAPQAPSVADKPISILNNQTTFKADLSLSTLTNKGTSAAKDETLILMESWAAPD